jgi:hypothetical protein
VPEHGSIGGTCEKRWFFVGRRDGVKSDPSREWHRPEVRQ